MVNRFRFQPEMPESVIASSFREILQGVYSWSAFSPHHKVELTSHAVRIQKRRVYVFDPILLDCEVMDRLIFPDDTVHIILTNGNHQRASLEWKKRTKARVFVHEKALDELVELPIDGVFPEPFLSEGSVKIIDLEGGGEGETGFYFEENRLFVVGDALVNLKGRGVEVLPEKYCKDSNLLRQNLRQLELLRIETMLTAHGEPIRNPRI